MQCSDASGEVIKCRQKGEVALIAPEQDVSQVPEAVNGLLDRGELPCRWTVSMFHLSVVLEKGDVVGGGLQTHHAPELRQRQIRQANQLLQLYRPEPATRPPPSGLQHCRNAPRRPQASGRQPFTGGPVQTPRASASYRAH